MSPLFVVTQVLPGVCILSDVYDNRDLAVARVKEAINREIEWLSRDRLSKKASSLIMKINQALSDCPNLDDAMIKMHLILDFNDLMRFRGRLGSESVVLSFKENCFLNVSSKIPSN